MVDNYRALLESGNRQALERELRDRRFDRTVEEAIANDEVLAPATIERMVSRYHDRFLDLRAETIARTESLRALSEARQEATEQIIEQTGILPEAVTRTWRATHDERTRDTHAAMDGQRVGLTEPFISPSGAQLMYPGDPSAPASETISCRCVVTIDIA
jgi:uncharacterized protein with gpF-like domain